MYASSEINNIRSLLQQKIEKYSTKKWQKKDKKGIVVAVLINALQELDNLCQNAQQNSDEYDDYADWIFNFDDAFNALIKDSAPLNKRVKEEFEKDLQEFVERSNAFIKEFEPKIYESEEVIAIKDNLKKLKDELAEIDSLSLLYEELDKLIQEEVNDIDAYKVWQEKFDDLYDETYDQIEKINENLLTDFNHIDKSIGGYFGEIEPRSKTFMSLSVSSSNREQKNQLQLKQENSRIESANEYDDNEYTNHNAFNPDLHSNKPIGSNIDDHEHSITLSKKPIQDNQVNNGVIETKKEQKIGISTKIDKNDMTIQSGSNSPNPLSVSRNKDVDDLNDIKFNVNSISLSSRSGKTIQSQHDLAKTIVNENSHTDKSINSNSTSSIHQILHSKAEHHNDVSSQSTMTTSPEEVVPSGTNARKTQESITKSFSAIEQSYGLTAKEIDKKHHRSYKRAWHNDPYKRARYAQKEFKDDVMKTIRSCLTMEHLDEIDETLKEKMFDPIKVPKKFSSFKDRESGEKCTQTWAEIQKEIAIQRKLLELKLQSPYNNVDTKAGKLARKVLEQVVRLEAKITKLEKKGGEKNQRKAAVAKEKVKEICIGLIMDCNSKNFSADDVTAYKHLRDALSSDTKQESYSKGKVKKGAKIQNPSQKAIGGIFNRRNGGIKKATSAIEVEKYIKQLDKSPKMRG